jgi:hypothetical protein
LPFTNLADQTREALLTLGEAVRAVPAPTVKRFPFKTQMLDPDKEPKDLTESVDDWILKGHRFIYFLQTDAESAVLEAVHARYSNAKSQELVGRAYARLNEPPKKYLYVGSSSSLGRRFREHLGYGARGTYALHLAHWSEGVNLNLELVVARYVPRVSGNIIGALEDQLWDALKPMFGRQGRR